MVQRERCLFFRRAHTLGEAEGGSAHGGSRERYRKRLTGRGLDTCGNGGISRGVGMHAKVLSRGGGVPYRSRHVEMAVSLQGGGDGDVVG